MLPQRVLSAAVGIPVIVVLVLIGGVPYTFAVAMVLALAALEFYAATDPETSATSPTHPRLRRASPSLFGQRLPAFAGCAGVALLVVAAYEGLDELTGVLAGLIAGIFLILIVRQEARTGLRDWLWVVAGVAYIGFLGSHLVLLRDLDDGGDWVFVAVFATFVADTAAYFAGRALGRRQIAVAVFLLVWVTGVDVDELKLVPLALLLPVVAVVGDLGESLIKRGAGVKDASDLVPGHGGFLDRLDSILFTTPLVYYFVIWVVL